MKEKSNIVIVSERVIPEKDSLADKLGDTHYNVLPTRKIIIILLTLSFGQLVSFMDQTSITVALPYIAKDLNAQETINWAGSASLLANCVCQVLFGRMSDIFGRKNVLMSCLLILVIGDIACGLSQTGVQFYIFRAFAGIGNGGVSSLGMVILSDIVTLEQRGRFQGILGASVGIANAIGPFIMSAFITHSSWRSFYYFLAPFGVVVIIAVFFLIESPHKQLNEVLSKTEKFKKIDYLGILTATAALTFILVPLSGGGSAYAWNSPIVIVLFVLGGCFLIIFLLIEWKIPELPMVPLHIFKNPTLCILMICNILFGGAYYSFMYYLPYFCQIVKDFDVTQTSILYLPLVLSQATMSAVAGQLITYSGHYGYIVGTGYFLWCLSCILLVFWNEKIKTVYCVLILLVMGTGVGFSFQPSMVAVQANCKRAERAVVISVRNVSRSFGGAIAITMGSSIISNSLLNQIEEIRKSGELPQSFLDHLSKHIYEKTNTSGLSSEEVLMVKRMYVSALRKYYYVLIAFMSLCFVGSLFVKDRGLQCLDEEPTNKSQAKGQQPYESSSSSSSSV
ncbi:MFS efflux transporter [Scheffersomyces amazonensis]|uniref:MFS efflux transporter n=1 Tax=Scheffersomyces amazonensis TaxID=1078765 RepID=UPI00315DE1E1